jgi:hypothetical protein
LSDCFLSLTSVVGLEYPAFHRCKVNVFACYAERHAAVFYDILRKLEDRRFLEGLQKTAFCVPKGRLLHAKRWPFAWQKATFWKTT